MRGGLRLRELLLPSVRSARHLLYTIALLVTGSALLTYNFCRHLPMQRPRRHDKELPDKRAAVLSMQQKGGTSAAFFMNLAEDEAKRALEGVLYEEGGGRLGGGDYLSKRINHLNGSSPRPRLAPRGRFVRLIMTDIDVINLLWNIPYRHAYKLRGYMPHTYMPTS